MRTLRIFMKKTLLHPLPYVFALAYLLISVFLLQRDRETGKNIRIGFVIEAEEKTLPEKILKEGFSVLSDRRIHLIPVFYENREEARQMLREGKVSLAYAVKADYEEAFLQAAGQPFLLLGSRDALLEQVMDPVLSSVWQEYGTKHLVETVLRKDIPDGKLRAEYEEKLAHAKLMKEDKEALFRVFLHGDEKNEQGVSFEKKRTELSSALLFFLLAGSFAFALRESRRVKGKLSMYFHGAEERYLVYAGSGLLAECLLLLPVWFLFLRSVSLSTISGLICGLLEVFCFRIFLLFVFRRESTAVFFTPWLLLYTAVLLPVFVDLGLFFREIQGLRVFLPGYPLIFLVTGGGTILLRVGIISVALTCFFVIRKCGFRRRKSEVD